MEEIYRLDLNDFPIPGNTLHYPWGYPSPGIPYLSIRITHWSTSLEAAVPKGLYPTLALQVLDQKSFHINWKIPHVVGSAWACALIFCSRILTEPSMPRYQLFPEFNYC